MNWSADWKDATILLLVLIGTICNILWSKKRSETQSAHINWLQDKINFLTELTPSKIVEYNKVMKHELESRISKLQGELKVSEEIIVNKEFELKQILAKGNTLEQKVVSLKKEIENIKKSSNKNKLLYDKYQDLSNNVEYLPVGKWFVFFKDKINESKEIKQLMSKDEQLTLFINKKISDGLNEKQAKKFWKHLEAEHWEDFLEKKIGQEALLEAKNIIYSKDDPDQK